MVLRFVALIAMACGGSQPPQPSSPKPSIVVVALGQEPRHRLRYEPKLHAREQMELSVRVSVDTAFTNTVLETGERKAALPTMRAVAHVEATAVTSTGDVLVTCEMENVELLEPVQDPGLRRGLEAELAATKSWRASWRMSPSGVVSDVTMHGAKDQRSSQSRLAAITDLMQQTSVVFPEEAVGIGGTWEVTSRATFSGVTWDRKATYTLRRLENSIATIDGAVVMRAASQALRVEPNASTRLTSASANSSGELTIALGSLVTEGAYQTSSEANFLIVNRRLRVSSTVRTQAEFSVKRLDGSAARSN